MFPIARNAREQSCVHGNSFVAPQHDTTAVHEADFPNRLPRACGPMSRIVVIQEFAGKRQLYEVFSDGSRGIFEDGEYLRARVHAVDRF